MKLNTIFSVLLLSIIFCQAVAQSVKITVAPEINFPTGNSSNISGIGFGGSLKAEVPVATRYAITASGGYDIFIGKKYFGYRTPNLKAVPVKLGLKYYSTPDFYVEAQGGAAFRQDNSSNTSFVWSGGIGTLLRTSGLGKVDFGLRYEAWANSYKTTLNNTSSSSFGFIGLKVGYLFHM